MWLLLLLLLLLLFFLLQPMCNGAHGMPELQYGALAPLY